MRGDSVLKKKKEKIPEWKRYELENRHKSLEEKKTEYLERLNLTIGKLKSLFEPVFLDAVKTVEGDEVAVAEKERLRQNPDSVELIARLRNLRIHFEDAYYDALDEVVGANVIARKKIEPEQITERAQALEKVMEQAGQSYPTRSQLYPEE